MRDRTKGPKNWGEREVDTLELERILGRSVPAQVAPKKPDAVEGESMTVGESVGGADMGDMMEDYEREAPSPLRHRRL